MVVLQFIVNNFQLNLKMDNLGTEVSAKIRSAIKAKLVELDAYVDDELPDYIMVMVANDRTKVKYLLYGHTLQ